MAVAGQARDLAGRDVDAEHRLFERVLGGDQQALAVRAPRRSSRPSGPSPGSARAPGRWRGRAASAPGGRLRSSAAPSRNRRACGRRARRVGRLSVRVVGVGEVDRRRAAVGWAPRRCRGWSTSARSGPPRAARNRRSGRRARRRSPRRRRTAWTACRRPASPVSGTPAPVSLPPATGKAKRRERDAGLGPGVPVADEQLVVGAARCRSSASSASSAQARSAQRRSRSAQTTTRSPVGASLKPPMSPLEVADLHRRAADGHAEQLVAARRPASGTRSRRRRRTPRHGPSRRPSTGCGAAPGLVRSSM